MEGNVLKSYSLNEQQSFSKEEQEKLRELNLDFRKDNDNNIQYLGLSPYDYSVSYYIGIDWLQEKKSYIVVHPKIDNLDYVGMFVHCLYHPEISESLEDIYHIDIKKPQIKTSTIDWDLTPFMIIHFLSLVSRIVKQGLKSNYIVHEENLNSKIKGKILWAQQFKKNIATKREDRIFCRYQEYSINCYENRLLKKVLLFIQHYSKCYQKKYPELIQTQNSLLSAFENISDDISYSEIKRIKVNALYKEYTEAIALAKKILHRFGYSYKQTDNTKIDNELPPFWIDMSKLFELYVYSLLKKEYPKEISYQAHGKHGYVDFLKKDDKLILDTKYKLIYTNDDKYNIENIRQLSGYARDEGILKKLKIFKDKDSKEIDDNVVVECIIIYPNSKSKESFEGRSLKEEEIKQFTKFYKCGIKLPVKENPVII
jgi:5-methylcytosine-specific restriction enzyme subunit McrC